MSLLLISKQIHHQYIKNYNTSFLYIIVKKKDWKTLTESNQEYRKISPEDISSTSILLSSAAT